MATNQRARRRATSDADKARRRASIVKAAKRVFARKGFTASTVADIARSARMSYGAVYWYFQSKEELFHAVLDTEQRALREVVTTALLAAPIEPASDDPLAGVRAALRATFEFFEKDAAAAQLLFREARLLGGGYSLHLYGIYESFIGDVATAIDAAKAGRLLRDLDTRLASLAISSMIAQLAERRSTTDDGVSAERMADFVIDMLMDGLRYR